MSFSKTEKLMIQSTSKLKHIICVFKLIDSVSLNHGRYVLGMHSHHMFFYANCKMLKNIKIKSCFYLFSPHVYIVYTYSHCLDTQGSSIRNINPGAGFSKNCCHCGTSSSIAWSKSKHFEENGNAYDCIVSAAKHFQEQTPETD